VLQDVGTSVFGGEAFLSASDNGTLIYLKRSMRQGYVFRFVDANGHELPGPSNFDSASMAKMGFLSIERLRVLRDGQRFVLGARAPGMSDVWTFNPGSGGRFERLTFDPVENECPVWSYDGREIAYTSAQTSTKRLIRIKTIEGGAQATLVRTWPRHVEVTSWSPDRQWLAATDSHPTNLRDIWLIQVDGKEPIPLANSSFDEVLAAFSPDGKWIAYASDESGRSGIHVKSFPGLQVHMQVSTDGGAAPIWDPQGRFLYYIQNGYLAEVEVETGGDFKVGRSRPLFPTAAVQFQVLPGGRFVLQEVNTQPPDAPIQLIVN
jgi:WD40 repeat protein